MWRENGEEATALYLTLTCSGNVAMAEAHRPAAVKDLERERRIDRLEIWKKMTKAAVALRIPGSIWRPGFGNRNRHSHRFFFSPPSVGVSLSFLLLSFNYCLSCQSFHEQTALRIAVLMVEVSTALPVHYIEESLDRSESYSGVVWGEGERERECQWKSVSSFSVW